MNYELDLGEPVDLSYELPHIYDLEDRFKHTYIIGKTGMGKSTLMLNMALYDINKGLACIFIDPKGDVVRALNNLIEDKDRIINVSIDKPVKINPLRKQGYDISDIVDEFVEILDVLIQRTSSNPESTVLMQEILDYSLKSFYGKQMDLDYLYKFLMFGYERKNHIEKTNLSGELKRYWKDFDALEANRYPKHKLKIDCASRVASRLRKFISDDRIRRLVCGDNELDIASIAREGKILLVDTSRMGDSSRIYISSLITHAIKSLCVFKGNDYPIMVYVDEFQQCFSSLFSHLLATARSYNVGFVLAHQTMSQVPIDIIDTVLGVSDTVVSFRCTKTEANVMAQVFNIPYQEFINLEKYQAWIRMGKDNILIDSYPPPEIPEVKDINFLKDAWFPC